MDARVLVLLKQWDRLKVQDGVVYRVSKLVFQLVLPSSLRVKALAGMHNLAEHQGQSRTLQLTRQHFFWPRMERECQDLFGFLECSQHSVDVLVMTDHFTKLAHAFPCINQNAKQVAKRLLDIFCIHSFPTCIHTNQGHNFESKLVTELLKLAGV